jgi:long-chain fatty acid transport protein
MGTITAKASQKVADLIPSIAWKPVPELALGLGIIFSTQEFSAQGLVAPSPAGPVTLSGHGTQTASGIGARVGVLWNPLPELGLGVTYKTRTSMGPLGGYANDILSYSGGAADVPAEYGAGIAWKISPAVIIAGDLILVKYGDLLINQDPLGVGWRDQPIVKLGLSWDIYSSWTLRTGMSSNRTQIYSSRTYQNILSPALSQTAYTLGASMRMDAKSDFSFSLELNPSQTIRGTDMSTGTNLEGKAQVMRLGYQRQF